MKQNKDVKHNPSTVAVFCSNDYSQFRMITGNRTLNMNKIKKIISDIEAGTNLLKYQPILVAVKDGMLDIIDGQHRFVVAKKIKDPVHYIIADELSLFQIAAMNSNTEKWSHKDFVNCYVALKNPHYIELDELVKQYPELSVSLAVMMLALGNPVTHSKDIPERFKRGDFVVRYSDKTHNILEKVSELSFNLKFSRYFLGAIYKIIEAEKYDVDELISKVNADPSALIPHATVKRYLQNLTEIANKNKRSQVVIY